MKRADSSYDVRETIRPFRYGRSPEEIFDAYPSIRVSRVYGAVTFILLEHSHEIDSCFKAQDEKCAAFKASNPLSPDMIERAQRDQSVRRS